MPLPHPALLAYLHRRLAEGFDTKGHILELAEIYMDEIEEVEVSPEELHTTLQVALAERDAEMRSWPAVTDCDRIDAAFEALNARGIMARHNWTCCCNCGHAEMPNEFDRIHGVWEGQPIIGYAFYHNQDVEAVAEGDPLHLSTCATTPTDSEEEFNQHCERIAAAVADVLRTHGLNVEWNGSPSYRIRINLNWQRRHPPARFIGDPDATAGTAHDFG